MKDPNGNVITANLWDDAAKNYKVLSKTFCGENRFLGVDNILEFYLTFGCTISIVPRNAIMARIRLEWTMD